MSKVHEVIWKQVSEARGFLLACENWSGWNKSQEFSALLQEPSVEAMPIEWCKYGLISKDKNMMDHTDSGIITNVVEITEAFEKCTHAVMKKKGQKPASHGSVSTNILHDVLSELRRKGWVKCRTGDPSMEACLKENIHTGLTSNTDRCANFIVEWLKAEELCDYDLANHRYLTENFPFERDI